MESQLPLIRTGLGQAKHRFLPQDSAKPCIIAGLIFEDTPGFQGNNNGDVAYCALLNAISSLTGVQVMSEIAEVLATREGISDCEVYLREAVKLLKGHSITHVAISLEAKRPYFRDSFDQMRANIAKAMNLVEDQVGITAISGDGLSDVSCGDGVQCLALITTQKAS